MYVITFGSVVTLPRDGTIPVAKIMYKHRMKKVALAAGIFKRRTKQQHVYHANTNPALFF
jgi:hypothetical protein